MINVGIRQFVLIRVFAILAAMLPGFALADSCACDSPCSGSVSCGGGCYAYCEENPENSGRHVCVKGCASEDTSSSAQESKVAIATDETVASE